MKSILAILGTFKLILNILSYTKKAIDIIYHLNE